MKCPICHYGDTEPGEASLTLERGEAVVVFRHVPADICQNCGERYFDQTTTTRLLNQAEAAIRQGVQMDVRLYHAA